MLLYEAEYHLQRSEKFLTLTNDAISNKVNHALAMTLRTVPRDSNIARRKAQLLVHTGFHGGAPAALC